MLPYPSLQDDLLLRSRQLYYLVTNKQGVVLKSNEAALPLLPFNEFSLNEIEIFLASVANISTIELAHKQPLFSQTINWEVSKINAEGQEAFQWVAPIPLENNQEEGLKLFQNNPLPAWIVNAKTCMILLSNNAATARYGFSAREFENSHFCNLLTARNKDGQKEDAAPSLAPEIKTIIRHVKKDGTSIWVDLQCAGFTFKQQQVYYVTGEDVTDKMEAQEKQQADSTEWQKMSEKNRLQANLVEQTEDVLTIADLEFKPLTWNKAAVEIYGLTGEEVIGRNIRDFVDIQYPGSSQMEVREALGKEGTWRGEMSFVRPKDNRLITLLTNFKVLKNERGERIGYLIDGTNITERKDAELKLKESERRFQEVANSAPVGIWMSDVNSNLTYVNKQLIHLSALDENSFKQLSWASLLHPEDAKDCIDKFEYHFKNRQPITLIYRLKRYDDTYRWVQDSSIPRLLEDGTFLGYIGSVVDIQDTKIQEEQLRYQATVLQNVSDIIVSTDLDFKIKSWNKSAENFFGLSEEEVKGRPFVKVVKFDFGALTRQKALFILQEEGAWKGEVSYTNAQQQKKHLLHTITYIYDSNGAKIGAMAVCRDITERKEAEMRVRQSELFYRNLIADSLDGMLLSDAMGNITFVSPSVQHILQYTVDEILGKSCFDFVHPEDITWAWESFQREVTENPLIKSLVIRLKRKDGEWIWCMVRGHNLLHNPYVRSIAIYFHDDTLRKNASDSLKQSEQRFRTLIRDIQVGVMLQNKEGNIEIINQSLTEMLEQDEEALVGKKMWDVYPHAIDEEGNAIAPRYRPTHLAMTSKKAVSMVMGVQLAKTGKRLWLIVHADPILDENNEVVNIVSSLTDITERKELEQKLVHEKITGQKLLTQATIDGQEKERREIGKELHDNIGQQLTTIKLYLEMIKSTANESSIEMVCLSLRCVSDVINEIRRMSRALMPPTLGDLGLVDSISDLIDSIKRTQQLHIELDYLKFDEDLLPENGKLMLFRIIQEQMNNIIKHSKATGVSIILRNNGKQLTLMISDNGCGFEPKTVRKGLGLTNIKNRAELFGGQMKVHAAPGEGCILKVHIPNILQPIYQ